MIKSITITNHLGETLNMNLRSPEQSGFFIRSIDGLGPVKSSINMTEVLSLDGAFFNSAHLGSRNIVFNLGFYDDGSESVEAIRQRSYKMFPTKKLVYIEVETDTRIGVTTGYVESNEPDIFSRDEGSVISILCPSAFFFEKNAVQTLFSGTTGGFQFPFENASLTLSLLKFATVFINTEGNVVYTGDEEIGVVIYINVLANVNNLTIYNLTNGESMSISSTKLIALTGFDLKVNDRVVISTVKGSKFIYLIRNGLTVNIINTLNQDADWFTIDQGDNVFTYTAASGVNNLQFMIEHQIAYKGM